MAANAVSYSDASAHVVYSSNVGARFLYLQDPSFLTTPTKTQSRPNHNGGYPLNRLYTKYIRRAWKRVSRATRRQERASILPDGFVLLSAAAAKRKSVLFA